ncbi:hypothetical protein CWE15_02120 [Aliidiomarina taiwanensis]|uniref:DAGKc domain-containing protein n=1 Tax=Aliidiomarina taiwanensis TaxID=946228 RepID=A0A432X9L0_9GAMM|nr:diacylglycerol kinase family protein [Aliidiomarina taiwanensis]RUO44000.1 hypothetical protein CWE15_02120 [Aliidiomarina taiwanensis]
MNQTNTLVVFNPLPQRTRGQRLQRLCQALDAAQRSYTLLATDADLKTTAASIQQQLAGADNLIVVGGDGTLHQVVNALALLKKPPVLSLVPAGTGNDFARGWLIPKQPIDAVIHCAVYGDPEPLDVGCVNDRYFINSVGVGFDGDLTKRLAGSKSWWPQLTYLLCALRQLFRYRGVPIQYRDAPTDIEPIQNQSTLLLVVANSPYFGAGMHIAPHAQHDSGELAWVHINECNLVTKLWSFASIYTGKHIRNKIVTQGQLNKLHIETVGVPMQADGEYIGCTPAHITSIPQRLTMRR